jgi:ERCC4-related helicase
MNTTSNELNQPSMRLLPHQIGLVDAFFDPASKRVILLRADVGLGKTTALVALMTRLLRERPAARVLLLAPGGTLTLQFVEHLRSVGTPVLSVDRYQFREMIETASGQEMWPAGADSVLSREFARQQDVAQALAANRWELLIVDEAHQFRGSLDREVLRRLGQASDRVVLSTASSLSSDLPDGFAEGEITLVQWRRDQVVDFNGALLDSIPRPVVHVGRFALSPIELSLAETVDELCRVFEGGTTQQHFIARSLRRSLQSSPAALESALVRIKEARNRAVQAVEPLLDDLPDEELLEDKPNWHPDFSILDRADGITSRALDLLEKASSDSKLGALVAQLGHIDATRTPSTRICVLTEYVNTLFYLGAEIESIGKTYHPYHGGMTAESRQNYLARFYAGVGGGILTATRAAILTAGEFNSVTDLLLYDVPGSSSALRQILGRFDRFGRGTQLNVHILLPSNGVGSFVAESLELLRQALGVPGSPNEELRLT